jgi:hypothetical protein
MSLLNHCHTEITPTRFVSCRRHGRGASYLAPPRTDPGVRNSRTGLLKDTRFRTPDCSGFAVPLSEVGLLIRPNVSGTSFL